MGDIVGVARTVLRVMCECLVSGVQTDVQVIVVCGTNTAAKEALEENWGSWCAPEVADRLLGKVHIKGFATNMDELMRSSHILVTKAGPGTIAEACICGLPIMISGFLPGQEEGNVSHVVDGLMGCFCADNVMLAAHLSDWLSRPDTLKTMSKAARRAGRPRASLDIARDIIQIMKSHPRDERTQGALDAGDAGDEAGDGGERVSDMASAEGRCPTFEEFVEDTCPASDDAAALVTGI